MNFMGQRWIYRIGNHTVAVDNAFTWALYGKERLVIDSLETQSTSGYFRLRQSYSEPWLASLDGGRLEVMLHATALGIACHVKLDGTQIKADDLFASRWSGPKSSWPSDDAWTPLPRHVDDQIGMGSVIRIRKFSISATNIGQQ